MEEDPSRQSEGTRGTFGPRPEPGHVLVKLFEDDGTGGEGGVAGV